MSESTIHILLVEDSPSDARLAQLWLERSTLAPVIVVVRDGEAAIDYLTQQPPYDQAPRPDLVLLDLNLPKLSGFEVLAEIRKSEQLQSLPVVILTASAIAEDVHRANQLQADRYLSKPSDGGGYRELVHELEGFWEHLTNSR